MSKIEVDAIDKQSGSTLTLGGSGTAVTLACGATQSGFGRTGTVDWDTTAKTTDFTAVSGNGYFVNTTSSAITVTLPASPSAGDIISISDYAGTAATNNITIARNGSNFEGGTSNGEISTNRQAVTLIYVDATQGWVPTAESDSSFQQPFFVTATGGTVTTCGDFKIHTFTGPGTFAVSCAGNSVGSETVDYLVVAGGGGGGSNHGAGGGGGGFRESSGVASGCYSTSPLGSGVSALPVTVQGYPITVGGGGPGGPNPTPGTSGTNSIFSTITSAGGGRGGSETSGTGMNGADGGSGGGSGTNSSCRGTPGSGNTPPVSPSQGSNGGVGGSDCASWRGGGGGGGAIGTGNSASDPVGQPNPLNVGPGGAGTTTSISGSSSGYSGGGGGGSSYVPGGAGPNGGAAGSYNSGPNPAPSASNNTGGGGGGAGGSLSGGNGGSGLVVIRYKFQ